MIFTKDHIQKILNGTKTQTRRISSSYRIFGKYGVQPGRGKNSLFYIRITGIRRDYLGDISLDDIKAEGYETFEEFKEAWTAINGSFNPDQKVSVICFEKVIEKEEGRHLPE